MLDTVILNIPQGMYKIFQYERFTPSAKGLFHFPYTPMPKGFAKCVQNPDKKLLKSGKYFPRLTLIKGMKRKGSKTLGFQVFLKVEFSLPKLIYGNNFSETTDKDFPKMIRILKTLLSEMGISIKMKDLKKVPLSGIHYSKNIILSKYLLCSSAIEEISRGSLGSRIDRNTTNYRNDGSSFRFHTNDFELVFYDKVKDLQQANISPKRSIEKENDMQLNIFDELANKSIPVFRMELRLGTLKRIKKTFKKAEIELEEFTFENLFSEKIAQKVLLYYFSEIEKSLFMDKFRFPENDLDAFQEFQYANPTRQRGNLLKLFSIIKFLKESSSEKVKERLGYTKTKKDRIKWSSIIRMIKTLHTSKGYKNPVLEEIKLGLEYFKPVKIEQFPSIYDIVRQNTKGSYQYSLL